MRNCPTTQHWQIIPARNQRAAAMIMIDTLDTGFGTLSVDVSLSDQPSGLSSNDRHFGRSVSQPRRHSRQRLHAGKPYCERQLNSQASMSTKKYLDHGIQVHPGRVAAASTGSHFEDAGGEGSGPCEDTGAQISRHITGPDAKGGNSLDAR